MRLAFEELGPTFVKLGQMLTTREDLLPSAWTAELSQLHSDVPPAPFDELYIKVRGHWRYLYRAIDSSGDTVESWFSERPLVASLPAKGNNRRTMALMLPVASRTI